MPRSCAPRGLPAHRLVGDPVDVVTGAVLDEHFEFKLGGPLDFIWSRHYDSRRNDERYPLGWGHTHSYHRMLRFEVDGVVYDRPFEQPVQFAPLFSDDEEADSAGFRLRRVSLAKYELTDSGGTISAFSFIVPERPAVLTEIRRGGNQIRFAYHDNGRPAGIIDSRGRLVRVETDDQGRVTTLTIVRNDGSAVRRLLAYQYDHRGNLVSGTDAWGNEFALAYDVENRLVMKRNQRGYRILYEYDAFGRCVHSAGEDGLHEVQLTYFPDEGRTQVVRGDGGEWQYFFNESGVVTRVIDPYGGVTSYVSDESGRVTTELRSNGDAVEWVYGAAGDFRGYRSSLGQFTAEGQEDIRAQIPAHRVAANAVEFDYGELLDARKLRPPRPDDAALADVPPGMRAEVECETAADPIDLAALVASGIEVAELPDGRIQLSDVNDEVFQEAVPHQKPRRWIYGSAGKPVRYTDSTGSGYDFEYASWNLLKRAVDPNGAATECLYTAERRLAALTDAGRTVSRYDYDLKDRLVRVHRNGRVRDEYERDAGDNLVRKLDGSGKTLLEFEIGPKGQRVARRLASGEVHLFEYDEAGRYRLATSNGIATEFAYDDAGRRTADKRAGRGVEHVFGPAGRFETKILEQFVIRRRRIDQRTYLIEDPTGGKHRIELVGSGIVVKSLSNGAVELAQYGRQGRCLRKVLARSEGSRPWTRHYTYSAEGALLAAKDNVRGDVEYQYDAGHRLVGSRSSSGAAEHFAYDKAGNLLRQPGLGQASVGPGNRLVGLDGDVFEYDERDRISRRTGADGAVSYRYDSRDQLVAVLGDAEWRAEYDALGRRVAKTSRSGETEYLWDTDRLAAELLPDGSCRVYVYAAPLALTPFMFVDYDSPTAPAATGRRYFVSSDQIGTPIEIDDDKGRTVWRAAVAPYGRTRIDERKIEFSLRFPGHHFDAETGLHYNRFRYYAPELGRYLQPDPLGIGGGLNLYAYPANPLVSVDVRGLIDCPPPPDDPAAKPKPAEDFDDEEVTKPGIQPPQAQKPLKPPLEEVKYADKALRNNKEQMDKDYKVVIYTKEQQETFRVVAGPKGELVYAESGRPVNSPNGQAIYVMDQKGNMYVHEKPEFGTIHHSSIAAGEQPAAAGTIRQTPPNPPDMINNNTGHFEAKPENTEIAKQEMKAQGVDTSNLTDESHDYTTWRDPADQAHLKK